MPLTLYNTRSRTLESFVPLQPGHVGLYTCGPTVYNYVHVGNLRTYIFEDTLRRVLEANGYKVNHVMNITDVGHLTDDADQGEDKMEKGARREGKTAWDIAKLYTEAFFKDTDILHILRPTIVCKATDHIPEQIAQVQTLINKGHTYETSDGIYFDTTTFPSYGALALLDTQSLKAGLRVDMGEKKNPHDFALWKFTPEGEKRQMEWSAFGRMGFPGWHIECSAMSMKYLGPQFDIHCGGVDHIPVHHTNEIAQAEAVSGITPWVQYWLHGEHLLIKNDRMAKSGDNFITLTSITEKGFDPLAYRYFILQTHYRKQANFTWEALEAAAQGLKRLRTLLEKATTKPPKNEAFRTAFLSVMQNDLNTAEALALLWEEAKKESLSREDIAFVDTLLALNLGQQVTKSHTEPLPESIIALGAKRQQARDLKAWADADRIRSELVVLGYNVNDTSEGQIITKI